MDWILSFFKKIDSIEVDQESIAKEKVTELKSNNESKQLDIRLMTKDDCRRITEILFHGFYQFIQYLIGKDEDVAILNIVRLLIEYNFRRYQDTYVAEVNSEVEGVCRLTFSDSIDRKMPGLPGMIVDDFSPKSILRTLCSGSMANNLMKIEEGDCLIQFLAVGENCRGKGIGKLLLEHSYYQAEKRGCKRIWLLVSLSNPQFKNLCEQLGYVSTKVIRVRPLFAFGSEGYYKMVKSI
ncbi:DgyrCDS3283 [Dimorphilus gyrociliatus]|uniref:DgyrCDS3283 n=1 Tax=Dimorphilus gyrociliatus TaxID=2664684 RepID=A0A7I8VDV6_9ANNE|nr:DgyrCDS3283 [Dimorphilus gyrociliatus]